MHTLMLVAGDNIDDQLLPFSVQMTMPLNPYQARPVGQSDGSWSFVSDRCSRSTSPAAVAWVVRCGVCIYIKQL